MKVILAQMDIPLGKKETNLEKVQEIIEASDGDLILFPELFTTGFSYSNIWELAEEVPGYTVEKISRVAGNKIVGGTILEKQDGRLYNTFVLIGGEGVLALYRKIHIFQKEKEYFTGGNELVIADILGTRAGMAVCYDLRFPEQFRSLLEGGAELFLIPAEFPMPRKSHWVGLIKARAIENQAFVIGVNRAGEDDRQEYFGTSIAVDPWGNILKEMGEGEETDGVDIDLSKAEEIRKKFPVLDDIKEM